MAEVAVTIDNFEDEVLKSDKPVLVDFWASWCGPCMMLAPFIAEIAEEREDIKVCKINTDENQSLVVKYDVMSIPTLMLFKNGEVVGTNVGLVTKDKILEFINQ